MKIKKKPTEWIETKVPGGHVIRTKFHEGFDVSDEDLKKRHEIMRKGTKLIMIDTNETNSS